jgi:outer membrane biosynthesis protein TonB
MSFRFAVLVRFLITSAAVPSFAITRPTTPYLHAQLVAQASSAPTGAEDDVDKIGGSVTPPVLVHSVKPEFPEEARNARLRAQVLVNLYVDIDGKPSNVHAIRITSMDKKGKPTTESIDPRVGKGLSEKATEAVKQYRFKPSTKNGKPVKVELNVAVDFQIF